MPAKKKNDAQTAASGKQEEKVPTTQEIAYHWLSQVEAMCRKAFVPDEVIYDRARTRIAARVRPLNVAELKDGDGKKRMAVSSSVSTWLARLDAPLSPEEERKSEEKASQGCANRDLLAHRIGRPTTTMRWQADPTDCYLDGGNAYRRRLAAIGRHIADLWWLPEPESHPWRRNAQKSNLDMAARERMAEDAAGEWAGA